MKYRILKAEDIIPNDDAYHGNFKILDIEWWYFDANFTNGYSLHIGCRTFSRKKLGIVQLFLEFYKDGELLTEKKKRFLFKNFDSNGLLWAIRQAMSFYNLGRNEKKKQIKRIMTESAAGFTHANTARQYIKLYEKMLQRPLINQTIDPVCVDKNHKDQ